MNRLLLLAALPALACGPLGTPPAEGPEAATPSTTPTPCANVLVCALLEPTVAGAPGPRPADATAAVDPIHSPVPQTESFPDPLDYEWVEVARGLARPVDIQSAADGSGRLFIVEKDGRIRILHEGRLVARPFLDIRSRIRSADKEQGLLGLAFHPNYAENGSFYVNYTAAGTGDTRIARFRVSDDANLADRASETVLLEVDQPFVNHNGGALAFGPDAYLYIALGDGGGIGDPFDHAQNTGSLLGKLLRIDVDAGQPYAIPADNPFDNEVWAYGFRNPWRFSFDPRDGALFIGDVGHLDREEIDHVRPGSPGGLNFGWDFFEGTRVYQGGDPERLTFPIAEYDHESGCAVIGGGVYRGVMPEWNGIYLYGDYCLGTIWGLLEVSDGWRNQVLFQTGRTITAFGADEAGEFYFSSDDGRIHNLVPR
jgi:glucose/arabinose dehydrogenase